MCRCKGVARKTGGKSESVKEGTTYLRILSLKTWFGWRFNLKLQTEKNKRRRNNNLQDFQLRVRQETASAFQKNENLSQSWCFTCPKNAAIKQQNTESFTPTEQETKFSRATFPCSRIITIKRIECIEKFYMLVGLWESYILTLKSFNIFSDAQFQWKSKQKKWGT